MLRMGLEPTSHTAYAPQAYMYTNSITWALTWQVFVYLFPCYLQVFFTCNCKNFYYKSVWEKFDFYF